MAQSAAWILVHSIFSIRVTRPKTVRRFAADDDQRFTNRGHGIRIQEPNGSQMNERTGVLIHMMGNRRFWNINQHMFLLSQSSSLWRNVQDTLSSQSAIGMELVLLCGTKCYEQDIEQMFCRYTNFSKKVI